jgi:hypothetical protein
MKAALDPVGIYGSFPIFWIFRVTDQPGGGAKCMNMFIIEGETVAGIRIADYAAEFLPQLVSKFLSAAKNKEQNVTGYLPAALF